MEFEAKIPWLQSAQRDMRWLVGVSGGADSMALLHILIRAGFQDLVVCHLDHQLRGQASTQDGEFVLKMCGQLGVPCVLKQTDVREQMTASGQSLETAARNARHAFFAQCAKRENCQRILLAHHADDQAETVLWNLLRGSHGLKGMHEEQHITIDGIGMLLVRPLLNVRHAELVTWLQHEGHSWREDASNLEPVAIRNRLRKEVFPLLHEISGRDAVSAFARAARDSAARDETESSWLQNIEFRDPQGRLHLEVLRELPETLRRAVLRSYLIENHVLRIDRALLDDSLRLLDSAHPAVVNLPGDRRLRRSGGRLWIDGPPP